MADEAAQVLDEPVDQLGEVEGVPCGPAVVVGGRVDGGAVGADASVRGQGEGQEQRGAEGPAVGRGVRLAECAVLDRAAGQVAGVLPASGGADPAGGRGGGEGAADAGLVEFGVDLDEQRGEFVGLRSGGLGVGLGQVGPQFGEVLLRGGGGVGFEDGFLGEVPAFAALGGAQAALAFGAAGAEARAGGTAGDVDELGVAGGGVGAAQSHRPDADAVFLGDLAEHGTGQGHPGPFRVGVSGHQRSSE